MFITKYLTYFVLDEVLFYVTDTFRPFCRCIGTLVSYRPVVA